MADDSCLFVTERHTFSDLIDGLSTACTCGSLLDVQSTTQVRTYSYTSTEMWASVLFLQKGHVMRVVFTCP